QGEHVGLMFPVIFAKGIEIGFAYTSFKWENNAKRNAGVTVTVIGLRMARPGAKYLYTDDLQIVAKNINGYLVDGADVVIDRRRKPLCPQLPEMVFGSMPRDGGGLLLSPAERNQMVQSDSRSAQYIKRFVGSTEAINGDERYCLWIDDQTATAAR